MDNYMLVRLFLIILAVVTLIVMVQRYNKLQQYNDSERYHDFVGYNAGNMQPVPMGTSIVSSAGAARPIEPTPEPLPPLPPKQVATPARQQIAHDARAVAKFQTAENDITRFYDDLDSSESSSRDTDYKRPGDCFPKDKLTAEDLLPRDAVNTKWAKVNPVGHGSVKDANFLQAGYHVGLNTSQGAKRNGNLQFRSEPPNSKAIVSPWLNSDYEPDLLRKPLEVGENM